MKVTGSNPAEIKVFLRGLFDNTETQDCEIGKKKSKCWMRFKLSDVHDTDMVIYLQKKTGKGHNIIS